MGDSEDGASEPVSNARRKRIRFSLAAVVCTGAALYTYLRGAFLVAGIAGLAALIQLFGLAWTPVSVDD